MTHYKIKRFASEAKKSQLSDEILIETLNEFLGMSRDHQQKYALGGNLFKLRIATKEGRGKSAGSRSILAFKKESRVIWLHLFSKNEKSNVTAGELKKLKTLSTILLDLPDSEIVKLMNLGELHEVNKNV